MFFFVAVFEFDSHEVNNYCENTTAAFLQLSMCLSFSIQQKNSQSWAEAGANVLMHAVLSAAEVVDGAASASND